MTFMKATGDTVQTTGLLDINGDGLPDYLAGSSVGINTGGAFKQRDNISQWAAGRMSATKLENEALSISLGGGGGLSGGEKETEDKYTGTGINAGVSGALNLGKSTSIVTESLIDINGDGLPDKVLKGEHDGVVSTYSKICREPNIFGVAHGKSGKDRRNFAQENEEFFRE
jgi:hypothetical protein